VERRYDVIVVGAGHAGIEAALASARLGARTLCVTLRRDRIGHLPCNCSIGGPAKGHIAREVDALGGQMGIATDHTLTHIRRVGTGKGPAVQTTRAQVCKVAYPLFMQETLGREPNLDILEAKADRLLWQGDRLSGLQVGDTKFEAHAVVLTTGTFLNGLCHEGDKRTVAAREGDQAVATLSDDLRELGIHLRRFKTGTTPRVARSSLRLDQMDEMPSEPEAGPLSFLHDQFFASRPLLPTWQSATNQAVHEVLRQNLSRSAMYGGLIEGVGPRYCPSVEDKVVRFADKDSHPIFAEIEEWDGESVYVQGFSTSMPADVQLAALRHIPGFAEVRMLRPGYAVEYDMADPLQLFPTLMSKQLHGLFLAGQLNGTSGYEEAAGQGIVAGINAARYAMDEPPVVLPREDSFIGVMIDDLVTKGVEDPYRMLTARAEHRLLLRHDNADQRLTPLAISLGLASEGRAARFAEKMETLDASRTAIETRFVFERDNETLAAHGQTAVKGRASLADLLRRPDVGLDCLALILHDLGEDVPWPEAESAPGAVGNQVRQQLEIEAVYAGYLRRQTEEVELARRLNELAIPADFDFAAVKGISYESAEKLSRVRPLTVGQAGRIPGVRPTDIALLIGTLRRRPALVS